jgi:hypothetical protein
MSQISYSESDVQKLRLDVQTFGFGVVPDLIDPSSLNKLRDEARQQFESAVVAQQLEKLSYRARIATLGAEGKRLLFGDPTLELLLAVSGEKLSPTADRSCLTFYTEGDHLGPHLDQPESECLITFIVYLEAISPSPCSPSTGLVLRVYEQQMTSDPLLRLAIPTRIGGSVIGRGSQYWHERPKLEKGEYVAALTGCYRRTLT